MKSCFFQINVGKVWWVEENVVILHDFCPAHALWATHALCKTQKPMKVKY